MDLACLGNMNTVLLPEVLLDKLGLDAEIFDSVTQEHETGLRSYT